MKKFSYWAQALDNTSPDHIVLNDVDTLPDDQASRQQVVEMVSAVTEHGMTVFDYGGIQLTANSHEFVIEIPAEQHDVIGRIAPLTCYGHFEDSELDGLNPIVKDGLSAFAKSIGRTLSPECLILIDDAIATLKKKINGRRKRLVVGSVCLAVLAVGALSKWQGSWQGQKTNTPPVARVFYNQSPQHSLNPFQLKSRTI